MIARFVGCGPAIKILERTNRGGGSPPAMRNPSFWSVRNQCAIFSNVEKRKKSLLLGKEQKEKKKK